MPASSRKAAARSRVLYTGEKLTAAEAGIPRDHSMGLDACLPEQAEFRALFAVGYLSHGIAYGGSADWSLAVLSAYTITVSPRFDRTVIITNVPDNVAGRLLRGRFGGNGLPGLRIEEHRGHGNYIMRHLPTGAELVVTRNSSGKPTGSSNEPYISYLATDTPLTLAEQEQMDRVPSMTADARCLLAGVFSRITAQDPCGHWAIGNWFYDPLQRPGWLSSPRRPAERRLCGSGDAWELHWAAHPPADDLLSALTDPDIGIPGAEVASTGNPPAVALGSATLWLHSRRA